MSTNGQVPEDDRDDEQPTGDIIDEEDPEELAARAREALEAGDHADALRLVGHALYQAADDEALHRLLGDVLRDYSGDALELLPDGEVDATVHALRALLLAQRGQLTEAVDRMLVQHAVDPEDPYIGWAVRWLRQPGAMDDFEVDPIALRFGSIAEHLPLDVDPAERERIAEFVPVLDALLERYPNHARLVCAAASILRKVAELSRALELAQQAVKLEPSFRTFMCLGRVEGAGGDLEAARNTYESAQRVAREPAERLQAQSELGELLCAQGQTEAGLSLLDQVLGRDPEQPLAFLARAYYRALRDDDDSRFTEVGKFADRHPDSSLVHDYLDRFQAEWLHPAPVLEAAEDFIAGAREAVEELAQHDPDYEAFGATTHRYVLDPPLPEGGVSELENSSGIKLPVDYRAFVTRVGARGAGPGYGLLPLAAAAQRDLLQGEFPYKRPVRPTQDNLTALERPLSGVLALAHHGCDYVSILVVRGPRAGSVWIDLRAAGLGLVPTHDRFSDWYRDWIRAMAYGEWPELPIEPGACAVFQFITSHLHAVEQKLGIAPGSLTEEQTREALSELPPASVGVASKRSFYYDDGEGIPPCPICEHMFAYFIDHRLLRPEQIRPGVAPRIARP